MDMDTEKIVRQHKEIEAFFSGGFAVRGKESAAANVGEASIDQAKESVNMAEKKKQLDKAVAKIKKCCQCGLNETRTNSVPGEGSPDAQIMFIGEAPGADEDAQGRPFVGRAGKLLEKMINAMGLQREDVFIANILKCRPPDNRDPKPDEIVNCLPFLQHQIEIIEPEVIVALGAHAAKTLLNTSEGIGKLRGRFHDYSMGLDKPPVKLLATYHPAYLLRAYTRENREKVWSDLQKVMREVGLPISE